MANNAIKNNHVIHISSRPASRDTCPLQRSTTAAAAYHASGLLHATCPRMGSGLSGTTFAKACLPPFQSTAGSSALSLCVQCATVPTHCTIHYSAIVPWCKWVFQIESTGSSAKQHTCCGSRPCQAHPAACIRSKRDPAVRIHDTYVQRTRSVVGCCRTSKVW